MTDTYSPRHAGKASRKTRQYSGRHASCECAYGQILPAGYPHECQSTIRTYLPADLITGPDMVRLDGQRDHMAEVEMSVETWNALPPAVIAAAW